MKRTLLLLFICIMICGQGLAQVLQIDGIRALSSDLSASVYSRNDYNGRACALVKVAFPKTGAEFEGNVIGKTEYKAGEYWVYLTADSKYLKMKHAEYTPLMIRFDDSTVGPVESKIVYGVRVSAGTKSQLVTFKITPTNSILTVDQKEIATVNGIVEIMLTPEEHSYVVFAPGYNTQGSRFMVYENNTNRFIIELEPKKNVVALNQQRSPINSTSPTPVILTESIIPQSIKDMFEMVYVEGGTFTMGASDFDQNVTSDQKPSHKVTLSSYYIGKYEVTQKQWVEIMGVNPSNVKGDNLPVENVHWNEIMDFIKKLNEKTGKNYRLPTEAEWEYAARGGNNGNDYKYSGSNSLETVAWYSLNSNGKIHPVGTKEANEIGIYDMSGNVWEWCSDWYDDKYYSRSPLNNPIGPSSGKSRVLRGGGFDSYYDGFCLVTNRIPGTAGGRPNRGFRLAMDVK